MADTKSNPMARRMKGRASMPGKPEDHIDAGISALDHADLPHETKHMVARVLFAAKTHASKGLSYDHLFASSGEDQRKVTGTGDKDAD